MITTITIIFAEGDHDAAFIYRILRANGYKVTKHNIGTFPFPINNFLKSEIKKSSIEELNLQEARTRLLPSFGLEKDNRLVLIYPIGGDSKEEIRVSLIKTLNTFNNGDPDALVIIKDTSLSVLYFFDSDNKGVQARLDEVKKEVLACLDVQFQGAFENLKLYNLSNINFGAFIFHIEDTEFGKLEDILIPLMIEGNEDIFDATNSFLSIHDSTKLFKDKLEKNDNGQIKKVNGHKYDSKKSLIGAMGQLQKSGKSNTVCISDADFLNDEKILNNLICNKIFLFIESTL